MIPFHDTAAPALDYGLEQRLQRLDKRLKLTYSPWSIDPTTGQPIEDLFGQPIAEPAQHLWIQRSSGQWRLVDSFPMQTGGFGYLNLRLLEANQRAVETHSPANLYRLMQARTELRREMASRAHKHQRLDRAKANQRRIGDLVFHGKSGLRQAKISSYPGQTFHRTPGPVLSDAREDGWELE